jgi:hypothetical protein
MPFTHKQVYKFLFSAIRTAKGFNLADIPDRELTLPEQCAYGAYIAREWNPKSWEAMPIRERRAVRKAFRGSVLAVCVRAVPQ